MQFETYKLWQIIGKSREQKRGTVVCKIEETVGRGCSEESKGSGQWWLLIGWVVALSHWLSCGTSSLAGLLPGKKEIFPPPTPLIEWTFSAWKPQVICQGKFVHESSHFRASQLHSKWSFPLLIFTPSVFLYQI